MDGSENEGSDIDENDDFIGEDSGEEDLDLDIQDDEDESEEEDDDYDARIREEHEKYLEAKAKAKESRPGTAPRPESPTSAKERIRSAERLSYGIRPVVDEAIPRDFYKPPPKSISAQLDQRLGIVVNEPRVNFAPEVKPASEPEQLSEPPAEDEPELEPEPDLEPEPELPADSSAEPETDLQPDPDPDPDPAGPTEAQPENESQAEQEVDADPEPAPAAVSTEQDLEDLIAQKLAAAMQASGLTGPSNEPAVQREASKAASAALSTSEVAVPSPAGLPRPSTQAAAPTVAPSSTKTPTPSLPRYTQASARPPPAPGQASQLLSLRARALNDLNRDLQALIASELGPGAAAAPSGLTTARGGKRKQKQLTLGMRGHLGLNGPRETYTPKPQAQIPPRPGSAGIRPSSAGRSRSSSTRGGRPSSAGRSRPESAGRTRTPDSKGEGKVAMPPSKIRSYPVPSSEDKPWRTNMKHKETAATTPRRGSRSPPAKSSPPKSPPSAGMGSPRAAVNVPCGSSKKPPLQNANYMEALRMDGLRKVGEANQFCRELQLDHRYRLLPGDGITIEVYEYKDRNGNSNLNGKVLREQTLDMFLQTHARLHKQVTAEAHLTRKSVGNATRKNSLEVAC
ncbi:hypothetical protein CYMTET_38460 [Cymbomonas tetramitiformis]|uniref:Uncharacterized protein n=1 Tax=Cymbomonas tetramitiformis TaxID=36881 RepID=A0AAE0F5G4_9CHLO|nr:hypothetical protein CYMTET_38460 [Cymbomonas tetramitiformis]